MFGAKKLVVVMVTSLSTIEAGIEDTLCLIKKVLFIYHLLRFQKDLHKTKALIDLNKEINTITSAYAVKLNLKIRKTNIGAQIIDSFIFNIFKIVLANF